MTEWAKKKTAGTTIAARAARFSETSPGSSIRTRLRTRPILRGACAALRRDGFEAPAEGGGPSERGAGSGVRLSRQPARVVEVRRLHVLGVARRKHDQLHGVPVASDVGSETASHEQAQSVDGGVECGARWSRSRVRLLGRQHVDALGAQLHRPRYGGVV